jgi:hypothetical protein
MAMRLSRARREDPPVSIRAPVESRGDLLDLPDEAFEAGDFLLEGFIAGGREIDPGPGAFPFVSLLDVHQPGPFQDGQVLPEVAGGQLEGGAQEAELHAPGLVGDGEDAEPDSLMNDVIQAIDGMRGHGAGRPARRSASAKPMLPSSSTAAVIT